MVNNFDQLFYQKPYLSEFSADLLDWKEGRDGLWFRLSQSCFYPLGGGQPGDRGEITLGGLNESTGTEVRLKVVDTVLEDGWIWHRLEKPSADLDLVKGLKVYGKIDFDRRFDFMQQHTGEHIVSGLVKQKYGYNNVGFKISEAETSFDFDGDLSWPELKELELLANEAIYKNLKVEVTYPGRDQLPSLEYRSKLDLSGPVRLVVIPGYDQCACAGTHVARTGEIGQIKIIKRESYKSGVRLHLLCGKRALLYQQKLQSTLNEAGQILSANLDNFIDLSKARESEIGQLKQAVEDRGKAWAKLLTANLENDRLSILVSPSIFSKKEWLPMARSIAGHLAGFVAFMTTKEDGSRFLFLHSEKLELNEFLPALKEHLAFKGGGNRSTLQGPLEARPVEVANFLRNLSVEKLGQDSGFAVVSQV